MFAEAASVNKEHKKPSKCKAFLFFSQIQSDDIEATKLGSNNQIISDNQKKINYND